MASMSKMEMMAWQDAAHAHSVYMKGDKASYKMGMEMCHEALVEAKETRMMGRQSHKAIEMEGRQALGLAKMTAEEKSAMEQRDTMMVGLAVQSTELSQADVGWPACPHISSQLEA